MCALRQDSMFDTHHPEKSQVHKISTLPIKDRLLYLMLLNARRLMGAESSRAPYWMF